MLPSTHAASAATPEPAPLAPGTGLPLSGGAEIIEAVADGKKAARTEYLVALAEWVNAARQFEHYKVAYEGAREVLRELNFPSPHDLLRMDFGQVRAQVDPELQAAAGVALNVLARQEWHTARSLHGRDRSDQVQLARVLFECSSAMDPGSIVLRRGLHAFMSEYRHDAGRERGRSERDTETLLESLKAHIAEKFGYNPGNPESTHQGLEPDQRADLAWALAECGVLARSRGNALSRTNFNAAEPHYLEAIQYARGAFAAVGLGSELKDIEEDALTALSKKELRELTKASGVLDSTYGALGRSDLSEAARHLGQHVAFLVRHSPEPDREGAARFGARPQRPEGMERGSGSVQSMRGQGEVTRSTVASWPTRAPFNEKLWTEPCRTAAESEPFKIPDRVQRDSRSGLSEIRNKERFPVDKLVEAIGQFAVEIDLLSRTKNDAAALYLRHYEELFKRHQADPIMLIRMQIGAGYLLDCEWLSPTLRHTARHIASAANTELQGMGLRRDLTTVQSVFRPIVMAAKVDKLRFAKGR